MSLTHDDIAEGQPKTDVCRSLREEIEGYAATDFAEGVCLYAQQCLLVLLAKPLPGNISADQVERRLIVAERLLDSIHRYDPPVTATVVGEGLPQAVRDAVEQLYGLTIGTLASEETNNDRAGVDNHGAGDGSGGSPRCREDAGG